MADHGGAGAKLITGPQRSWGKVVRCSGTVPTTGLCRGGPSLLARAWGILAVPMRPCVPQVSTRVDPSQPNSHVSPDQLRKVFSSAREIGKHLDESISILSVEQFGLEHTFQSTPASSAVALIRRCTSSASALKVARCRFDDKSHGSACLCQRKVY